jgi:N-acetylneuraminic acid mutarotase
MFKTTAFMGAILFCLGAVLVSCQSPGSNPADKQESKPHLTIQWRLGPDYPMGIQDSAVGMIHGKLVSAGGFTRHPLEVAKQYPDAFGGEKSGFTKLAFIFDPKNESAGWKRIPDMPGPARQGGAVAVVDDALYLMGGINYTEPLTYRETYRLRELDGKWVWDTLDSCRLPWPVYGASASTAVIGKKIYLCGGADYFKGPGATDADFHSEAGRDASPVGRALLVLDTANLDLGWKRLADCPGLPKFDTAFAAAGGKLYQLSGIFAPLAKSDMPYYNAIDSWCYDPATDQWTRLQDMPHGSNRRALAYADRYILLITEYTYPKTRNYDGNVIEVSNDEKKHQFVSLFQKTVRVYDTQTGELHMADFLIEPTSYPAAAIDGDTLYTLGGEGGPRLYHPATLQIGKIKNQ